MGGILIDFLDDVAADEDLASDDALGGGVFVGAGAGGDVDLIGGDFFSGDVDELSVVDGPNSFVLHVVDPVLIVGLEHLDVDEHGADLLEGGLLFEIDEHFLDVEVHLVDALGCDASFVFALEHLARFLTVGRPLL